MSEFSLKMTRGMLWSLAENFGLQAVQFVLSVILARLLLPEQFGLIGMLMLFMALAQSLLDSGFGSALIQKKDADQVDASSVFYFNLLVGLALTGLLFAGAPLIAGFYREPLLVPLTRFLSLNIFINGFSLVPSALLTKHMDFKALLKVSLLSILVSGVVGVGLAFKGMGVWSLAAQSVLSTFLRALLFWRVSGWRPSFSFSGTALASLFSFGSRMMMSGLLHTFFQNIYQPLIGRVYSPADVGYYTRAQTLQAPANQPAGSVLGRVLMPGLASIQDDPVRLKQTVRKVTATALFFHFPLIVGLIVAAEPLILVLLTERWAPSIPYFQLFCAAGLLFPLQYINLTILQAIGRSDLFFRLEVIKKILVLLMIAITFGWGITALLWGQVAMSIIAYALNSHYAERFIGYSTMQQVIDGSPYLLLSGLAGGAMFIVGRAISSNLLTLFVEGSVGIIVYLGLNYVAKRTVLTELIRLAGQALQLRRQPGHSV